MPRKARKSDPSERSDRSDRSDSSARSSPRAAPRPPRERPSSLVDTFFVAFDFSDDALTEIDAFFRRSHAVIVPLTVKEILEEQLAQKLA